jgi:hypothetical protein
MKTCSTRNAEAEGASFSGARTDAPSFCPERRESPLLAALGIFTLDEHTAHRSSIRSTWLADAAPAGIGAAFVLHGLGARLESLREAETHGDIVFLRAPAVMACHSGPLQKLVLWLSCAVSAYPRATLIGKADDDVWAHAGGVAAHLRATLAAVGGRLLLWGIMESYHWDLHRHRPAGFGGNRFFFRVKGRGRRAVPHIASRLVMRRLTSCPAHLERVARPARSSRASRSTQVRAYESCTRRAGSFVAEAPKSHNYSGLWPPAADGRRHRMEAHKLGARFYE